MVQAIIMAGGEGSRLRPLTCDRPKPMVPVGNKPVMEYAVDLLKKHGITDIGVTLQYLPLEIMNYFGDGSDFGVSMDYFVEDAPLGTAGSVKNTGTFLQDTFIVVSGDALTDFDLSQAIEFHRQKGALATLVLTPVNIPLEYGVVMTGKEGEIIRFLEKPGWGEVFSDTVNTGIYVLEPEVLQYIPERTKFDFSQDLFPKLLKEGKIVVGCSLNGYWCDIGNLKQYQEAHYALMEGKVLTRLYRPAGEEYIKVGTNCDINPTAKIKGPVIIGDNSKIGANAIIGPYAVLGNNSEIGDEASIKKAILWKGSYVGKSSEVRGAVLCNQVVLKERSSLYEGVVVGDGTVLEPNVRIEPDTKVWPKKVVEKGTRVHCNIVWGTGACRSIFGADSIKGRLNEGLTPERIARIGAAFGAVVGEKNAVLVSCDGRPGTAMLKSAIESGLMSVGVNVLDGGSIPTAVHRHSIETTNAYGGIHLKTDCNEKATISINFFNKDGLLIDRNTERKIENLYERDDFRRASGNEVGGKSYLSNLSTDYVNFILQVIHKDLISKSGIQIVYAYNGDNGSYGDILKQVFNGLGSVICDYIPFENCQKTEDIREIVGEKVYETVADLGVIFDDNGENFTLLNEMGEPVDQQVLSVFLSTLFLEVSDKPIVAAPVSWSSVVEEMAKKKNGSVVRTKNSLRSFMKETAKPEITKMQGALNQAVLSMDALAAVGFIMEHIARKRVSLSYLIGDLPDLHMTNRNVDCPWSTKGSVIRKLIDENKDKQIELVDGVKIYHKDGWALILPDPEEPQYNVVCEGFDFEFAESLADFYINKINQLKQ